MGAVLQFPNNPSREGGRHRQARFEKGEDRHPPEQAPSPAAEQQEVNHALNAREAAATGMHDRAKHIIGRARQAAEGADLAEITKMEAELDRYLADYRTAHHASLVELGAEGLQGKRVLNKREATRLNTAHTEALAEAETHQEARGESSKRAEFMVQKAADKKRDAEAVEKYSKNGFNGISAIYDQATADLERPKAYRQKLIDRELQRAKETKENAKLTPKEYQPKQRARVAEVVVPKEAAAIEAGFEQTKGGLDTAWNDALKQTKQEDEAATIRVLHSLKRHEKEAVDRAVQRRSAENTRVAETEAAEVKRVSASLKAHELGATERANPKAKTEREQAKVWDRLFHQADIAYNAAAGEAVDRKFGYDADAGKNGRVVIDNKNFTKTTYITGYNNPDVKRAGFDAAAEIFAGAGKSLKDVRAAAEKYGKRAFAEKYMPNEGSFVRAEAKLDQAPDTLIPPPKQTLGQRLKNIWRDLWN